ncbi:MAG: response regulator [Candidatus Thorarchaeota archaeon]|nr:response regulator [Candidatus Thorarchaeota archaeon]
MMVSIMIVDDDVFLHEILERLQGLGGHAVTEHAFNGAEALQRYVTLNPKPDIVLMNHRMPVMNGVAATQECKEMNPDTVVVFISADDSVKQRAMKFGALGFMTKPTQSKNHFEEIGRYTK